MDHSDVVMLAEDRHAERLERKELARETAAKELADEYMAASAYLPLTATVSVPSDIKPANRISFLDKFLDDLHDRKFAARAVAILRRSGEGKALLQEMANEHGEWYADDAVEFGDD